MRTNRLWKQGGTQMCVIARVPEGTKVPMSYIENMWNRNSHGAGIGYIDENNNVQIEKSMKLKEYKRLYKEISKEHSNRDMLLHFRIATLGTVCLENTHPFKVNKNTIMAHNGMLPEFFEPTGKAKKLDLSDTRYFVDYFMKFVDMKSLDDRVFINQLGRIIDSENYPNKLVFLTSDKRLKFDSYIINEKHGEYDKKTGIWFSNGSYCKPSYSLFSSRSDYTSTTISYNPKTNTTVKTYTDEDFTKYDLNEREITDDCWTEYGLTTEALVKEFGKAIVSGQSTTGWECIYCGAPVEGELRGCNEDCDGALEWYDMLEIMEENERAQALEDYNQTIADDDVDITAVEAKQLELKLGKNKS